MLKKIISSQLRVFIIIASFAALGLFLSTRLPISLFPNSSKPHINIWVSYGGMGARDFIREYGARFEFELKSLKSSEVEVEEVEAKYNATGVTYDIEFEWGGSGDSALREVTTIANSLKSKLPKEAADSMNVRQWNRNTGFLAISFFSNERSLNEIYDELEPIIVPELGKVQDSDNSVLWNPTEKEILVSLDHEKMAMFGILPKHVENAILGIKKSYSGYSLNIGKKDLAIKVKGRIQKLDDLKQVPIRANKNTVYLSEIATVSYATKTGGGRTFKTNGAPSLILWASPKTGGNVKKMSEDIIQIVKEKEHLFAKDIQYKILVDPSHFIRNAINNVFKEVGLAACLAVFILFLFVGSFKNVMTAAIEIPLSMILAFIMMKLTNMNLNLISLGGLALASGMNVDASVVVLENIFRHQEQMLKKGIQKPTFMQSLNLIAKAASEVALPVFVSMITSLVVFIPLAFTSDLTNAILGDLAKAVIFSHGFSAFVALTLVPTFRFIFMRKEGIKETKAPVEKPLTKISSLYSNHLEKILFSKKKMITILTLPVILLVFLFFYVVPSLPKEIIGKPDSDWMVVSVNSQLFQNERQMDNKASEVENRALEKFGEYIKYTFVMVNGKNQATVMLRLHEKKQMDILWKKLEKEFENAPGTFFWVGPWNPAELPLPNPSDFKVYLTGREFEKTKQSADSLKDILQSSKIFKRTNSRPSTGHRESIVLTPYVQVWDQMGKKGVNLNIYDLISITNIVEQGKKVSTMSVAGKDSEIKMKFASKFVKNIEDVRSFPLKVDNRIVPMKALVDIKRQKVNDSIYRVNEREVFKITSRLERGKENTRDEANAKARALVESKKAEFLKPGVAVEIADARKVLTDAMDELIFSIGLSLALVFIVLLMQFQNAKNVLIVMSAIPLGIVGVLISLYVFKSNISLNSVLGIILLNGIAVNNSILLVEFGEKLFKEGMLAHNAVIEAATKRLRPIIITSLTTILGMFPIAIGMGEGGKILQPLGIAVCGGLAISTFLTLVVVPSLHYLSLRRRDPAQRLTSKEQEEKLSEAFNKPMPIVDPTQEDLQLQ
jgi:HAE1 family hydrophobic/amphiphilic exporter-1